MKSSRTPEAGLVSNFEEHVMLAVLRTGADAYGMAVRRELETVTGRDVTIGSVYITLDRLEAKLGRFADRFHATLSRELEVEVATGH